ncbi:MAG: DUF1385 domain-containing protein [Bacillaceae bacterium]|nr:DUF1385 domain-containing protein [Bacillaceae bacterium]
MANQETLYGGQAVIEGVMFGGKKVTVTAIRRKDNSIDYYQEIKKEPKWVQPLKKMPFVRGIVALVYAAANGSRHLNFASERYDVDPSEDKQVNDSETGKLTLILGVALAGVLSLILGKLIFTVVPAVLASLLFDELVPVLFLNNLLEGLIKVTLLVGYILAISQTPIIKRLFQYHGAEHKVINAYEAGVDLTVENVQRFSTLHYRCGSSFMIFTVLVGVLIYSLPIFDYDTIWERVYLRILLLPVVIGVSYETLQFTNKLRDIPVLQYLGYPGLWLQKLTTRQPDDQQVEVAIASFNKMREADNQLEQKTELASTG